MQVGPAEILVILIVALLVFGPHRLPEVGRQVGAAVRELRRMQDAVRGELDMVLHPEHGTRSADEIDEPGDHIAADGADLPDEPGMPDEPEIPGEPEIPDEIVTNDIGSIELASTEHPAPDSGSTDPSSAPLAEEDSRFHGPPDSFI